jgi:formylglycine-generating enzyme required for sulfatase activity
LFLNWAACESDPSGFYNSKMRIRKELKGGKIIYGAYPATANTAVTYVSWYDALHYCNWLGGNYGTSLDDSTGQRNKGAKYFLPTEDEWYKAAYYDPKTKKYKLYPLRNSHKKENSGKLASKSSYGMMETSDHVWEWTESKVGEAFRGIRSDSWFQGNNYQAAGRYYTNPNLELGHLGFRVARTSPESTNTNEVKKKSLQKRARKFRR